MTYSNLSWWPLLLFGVLEPIALVWAYIVAIQNPFFYYADQAPNFPIASGDFPPQALGITMQLINIFMLLAAVAVICTWTPHWEISKRYLLILALADLGHIYATYTAIGSDLFLTPSQWNSMIAGNIGASIVLHINRLLTVLGVFGDGKKTVPARKKI